MPEERMNETRTTDITLTAAIYSIYVSRFIEYNPFVARMLIYKCQSLPFGWHFLNVFLYVV